VVKDNYSELVEGTYVEPGHDVVPPLRYKDKADKAEDGTETRRLELAQSDEEKKGMTDRRHILKVSTPTYNELRRVLEAVDRFEPVRLPGGKQSFMPDFQMGEFVVRHKVQLEEGK
jgi:hypothetical protein